MGHSDIGPKEAAQRAMREAKLARNKPTKADLEARVAQIKPKPPKAKKKKGRR
jgi:hypothetical protein